MFIENVIMVGTAIIIALVIARKVVLGQYKLVLLGIMWYRVSKRLLCLYILGKGIFERVALIPDTQTKEYRATQLV